MEETKRISRRRRRLKTDGEPHPWEPRHMKLSGIRYAESLGDTRGRRNVTLGVIQHLWRSPVPFIGFYAPEGVKVTENRLYTPAPPKLVADAWCLSTASPVAGDLAPFVWAYRHCGFCLLTLFDKDIKEIRDDLLFIA